jgi:hypothetical protein
MRVNRTAILSGTVALALVAAGAGGAAAAERRGPTIRLSQATRGGPPAVFEVVGVDPAALAKLAKAGLKADQWTALFTIHVAGKAASGGTPPAVLGSYQVKDNVIRFEPRFPLVRGLRYRAVFDPSRLPGGDKTADKKVEAEFTLPKPAVAPTTVVRQVYPTSSKLPENQLKFYLHFSAPMSRGDVYRHIKLLNAAGKPVELPFLELVDELWDRDAKRLTLLFDPGRIKRGLKPREDLGPVLEEGKTYTLVIDRNWQDAEGNPLKESFRKTFKVMAPEDRCPDLKAWKIEPPQAGTTRPLTVRFPRPMDHALLNRVVWVTDANGKSVGGTVAVTDEETRWHFTPERPWQAGAYHLVAETSLEDLAGNNLERPFEVDVFRPIQREMKVKTVQLPFQVRADSSRK